MSDTAARPSTSADARGAWHSIREANGIGGARRDRTDDLMLAKHALSQLSYGPGYRDKALVGAKVVGLGRLELPTSRLSSARSNQLSYKPDEASSSGFAAHWRKTTTEKEGKRGRRQGAVLSNVEVRGGS